MLWPAALVVRPLTAADAAEIATWRYPAPWQVYDSGPELLRAEDGYQAVAGGGVLVGFCCSGGEARVPGLAEAPGILDIGVGMNPAGTGSGHGLAFGRAVLGHFGPIPLRAVVQSWNERSLRLTRKLGFTETGRHSCRQNGLDVEYRVLVRR
jgi:ribosomal-protein-alanine N-acetyltransferase